MATPRSQRIGIWIIAIVMICGTLGSFLVMALSVQNQETDQAASQKAYKQYLDQQKVAAKTNSANSEPLDGYSASAFDPASVTSLKIEVLNAGTDTVVQSSDSINVSYFGWMSDGTIFDSSNKKSADDKPIDLTLDQVINGWKVGLSGQKVGAVVRLTIPADQAYGSQESGIIPANSPLVFIVEIHKINSSKA